MLAQCQRLILTTCLKVMFTTVKLRQVTQFTIYAFESLITRFVGLISWNMNGSSPCFRGLNIWEILQALNWSLVMPLYVACPFKSLPCSNLENCSIDRPTSRVWMYVTPIFMLNPIVTLNANQVVYQFPCWKKNVVIDKKYFRIFMGSPSFYIIFLCILLSRALFKKESVTTPHKIMGYNSLSLPLLTVELTAAEVYEWILCIVLAYRKWLNQTSR